MRAWVSVPPLGELAMPIYRNLLPGDPAPWFHQRSSVNPNYAFDAAAGRYLVLCFFLSAAHQWARAALDAAAGKRSLFNDEMAAFFGVSIDPADEQQKRVATKLPGYRYFWDGDSKVSKLYGAVPVDGSEPGAALRQLWVVLDPTLRILKVVPFREDGSSTAEVLSFLEQHDLFFRKHGIAAAGIDHGRPVGILSVKDGEIKGFLFFRQDMMFRIIHQFIDKKLFFTFKPVHRFETLFLPVTNDFFSRQMHSFGRKISPGHGFGRKIIKD